MAKVRQSADALEPKDYYIAGNEDDSQAASPKQQKVQAGAAVAKKQKKSIFEDADLSALSPEEGLIVFKRHLHKTFPSASELELEDLMLTETAFGKGSHSNSTVNRLEAFLLDSVQGWQKYCKDSIKGPRVLILSSSAIRCVELLKHLPKVRNQCTIAKLFAKHIKIPEQVAFLSSHKVPLAMGTPARLLKLANESVKGSSKMVLDLSLVEHVIVDGWRDPKDRTIYDIAEIRKELFEFLCKTLLRQHLNSAKAKLYFF